MPTGLDSVTIAFLVGFVAGWGLVPRPAWIEPYIAWITEKSKSVFALWGKTPPPLPPNPPVPGANPTPPPSANTP